MKEKNIVLEKKYLFVIRRVNCATIVPEGMDSDIDCITEDEEYAKSRQSVFCRYEKVRLLTPEDIKRINGIDTV
jgi:hypothetical protein